MITTNIGRIFLRTYNERMGKAYSAKEFFDEILHPLVYGSNKYLQWVQNSPFVQMKKGQKVDNLTPNERQEKLEDLHEKISTGNKDASIAIGYAASEEKGYASTSGQVTNIPIVISENDIYYSWIGSCLALGIQGGISIMFEHPEILLDTFIGWKYYRRMVDSNSSMKGNQLSSAWNAQWLAHKYSRTYDPENPLANFSPIEPKGDELGIKPISWIKILIGICRHLENPQLLGYVFSFGQTNTTIGFIPFALDQIRYPLDLYKKLFTMSGDKAEELWGTAMGFQKACQQGSIGITAMKPKGLREYITGKKLPKYKDDEQQTILFNTYITWMIAMLNNEELWVKAQEFANALQAYATAGKQSKTGNSRKVDEVIKATNKNVFISALVNIIGDAENKETIDVFAQTVNTMPTDNVPYFLTLVRFQYAKINNTK